MKPTNLKLEERARRIIMQATDCDRDVAEKANGSVRKALD